LARLLTLIHLKVGSSTPFRSKLKGVKLPTMVCYASGLPDSQEVHVSQKDVYAAFGRHLLRFTFNVE